MNNFIFENKTKVYFGKGGVKEYLGSLLGNYGETVMLAYGGGSIKRNGVYDGIMDILNAAGKRVVEFSGIMSNPTYAKVQEGAKLARENHVDLILAVGGGSVSDCCKVISAQAKLDEDIWEMQYTKHTLPTKFIPLGTIVTVFGTGSEMNGGAVITNHKQKLKIGHVFGENVFPKFSILNPEYTFTLPKYQMVAGFYDIMNHITEQYFSDTDDCTSDYVMEGLMKSLIYSSRIAVENPRDYEARSNIMWIATWALNTMVAKGKTTDWMVHMIGQSVGAYTDATHGMTLSAVSLAYYRYIMPYGVPKFKRFAINVWNVDPDGKSDEEIANEGLCAMESWMKEIGLVMNISELGVTEDMLEGIANGTFIMEGGYKTLNHNEILQVLKESMI